ncbi:hypothetical protein [Prauserella cavernicola]|uniref:Uncharacterized protein n=1 Tax=Prauserella cavernicola TaxID=2800127 RepID=A0A934V4F3_9PSEU|nr:hypothetical protein [Prauserella cavernicola]MBK1783523.1 hypothetical protein [Prauserella cavernicola]
MSGNDGNDKEPTLDIARGDAALSKHLKNSLGVLKDKVDDPQFKRLVDDIVSGRRSLRDMASDPTFTRALDPLVEQGAQTYRELSDEDKEELARQGEEQFEQLREDIENPSAPRRSDDGDDDLSDRTWMR